MYFFIMLRIGCGHIGPKAESGQGEFSALLVKIFSVTNIRQASSKRRLVLQAVRVGHHLVGKFAIARIDSSR